MNILKNNKKKLVILLTIAFGVIFRIMHGFNAVPNVYQHDVWGSGGHAMYAMTIFTTGHLPTTNERLFYHPPLNAIMQALWMRLFTHSAPKADLWQPGYFQSIYTGSITLSIIYSIILLIFVYKIVKILKCDDFTKIFVIAMTAFYPGIINQAGQYNNDGIAYMFFFISLYFAIKWFYNQKLSTIILLAIFIALSMLSKISMGVIAFIVGPMILYRLIKSNFKLLNQVIIFAVIVFPLGLSYALRNYILFGQSLTYVDTSYVGEHLWVNKYNIVDRFLSFPTSAFQNSTYGIFHSAQEYNIWVDLVKTSLFDEMNLYDVCQEFILYPAIVLNISFYLFGFIVFLLLIITTIKNVIKKSTICKEESDCLPLYMSGIIYMLSVVTYIIFNVQNPYSCTSSFRYVLYIVFAISMMISLKCKYNKILKNISYVALFLFFVVSLHMFVMAGV